MREEVADTTTARLWVSHGEKVRYLFVGAWNTLFGYLLFVILLALIGEPMRSLESSPVWLLRWAGSGYYVVIGWIGWIIAVVQSTLTMKHFVFRSRGRLFPEIARAYMVYLPAQGLSSVILWVTVSILRMTPQIGQLVTIAITTVFSYIGHKYFTFKAPPEVGAEGEVGEPARAPSRVLRAFVSMRESFIVLVYSLTHGLVLLNRGLFWDDWVFWKLDMGTLSEASRAMGSTWPAFINRLFFYSDSGITFGRLVTFGSLLVAVLALYGIVRRVRGVSENAAMWVAVVAAVFPVFEARVALVLWVYAVSLGMFMAGLWLLVGGGARPSLARQVAAAVLFFGSFRTGSTLVLFAVVPVIMLAAYPPESSRARDVVRRIVPWSALLPLPVAYWLMTRIWFKPTGLYAGYNEITGASGGVVDALVSGLLASVWDPLVAAFSRPFTPLYVLIALVVGLPVVVALFRWSLQRSDADIRLLWAGVLLLLLAVVPYVAVGKTPSGGGWMTRHQLLIPLGAALAIVGLLQAHTRGTRLSSFVVGVLLLATITVSSAHHIENYIAFQRDWLEQQALGEVLRNSPEVIGGRSFLIEDATEREQWGRRYYEYTGVLSEVFGDERRFMIAADLAEYAEDNRAGWAGEPFYKLGDYDGSAPEYLVTVSRGDLDLWPVATVARLTFLDWTDRERLRSELADAIVIDVEPIAEK